MTTSLQHCLVTAACMLSSLPALATTAGCPEPAASTVAAASVTAPVTMAPTGKTTTTMTTTTLEVAGPAATDRQARLLDDIALDTIDAAGLGASAYSVATADRGQAASFSMAQLVSSQIVTVSLSQSLAIAVGTHPRAATEAQAGRF